MDPQYPYSNQTHQLRENQAAPNETYSKSMRGQEKWKQLNKVTTSVARNKPYGIAVAALGLGAIAYYWPEISQPRHARLDAASSMMKSSNEVLKSVEGQAISLRKSLDETKPPRKPVHD
jgi:hypothetical protein